MIYIVSCIDSLFVECIRVRVRISVPFLYYQMLVCVSHRFGSLRRPESKCLVYRVLPRIFSSLLLCRGIDFLFDSADSNCNVGKIRLLMWLIVVNCRSSVSLLLRPYCPDWLLSLSSCRRRLYQYLSFSLFFSVISFIFPPVTKYQ